MALTFESKSITKTVSIDDLSKLSRAEIALLKDELEKAVLDMDASLADITYEKHQDGLEPNKNWVHAINKKQKICETFLQTINDQLHIWRLRCPPFVDMLGNAANNALHAADHAAGHAAGHAVQNHVLKIPCPIWACPSHVLKSHVLKIQCIKH